ncbi:hypothetical protein BDM02DRAFT_2511407 [Thelephora ganbajun]|uniref:Uncharacterized protein n=1 Tax=Thelephora ganbajun TaxID=370292 RepID=A0ACB6ZDI9_THEGA|nr:hypothetical protein BDM02DRAFT_2511407 [Thelephora ganbajun]
MRILQKEKTVASRLKPTIDAAMMERDKFRKRSSQQGILINGAIGLQVIVGALTTGIAAAGSAHIGAAVATLGGISTILASYLAKVRGSGEPELSTIRTRELNSFLREVEGFLVDHGEETGTDQDDKIATFREQFESIIKTDGEDSGSGTGNSQLPQSSIPPQYTVPVPVRLANGQPGMGQIPIPVHPANGHVYPVQCIHCLDEKQQLWRNEKVINGVA